MTLSHLLQAYDIEKRATQLASQPRPVKETELQADVDEMRWLKRHVLTDDVDRYLTVHRVRQSAVSAEHLELVVRAWERGREQFRRTLGQGAARAHLPAAVPGTLALWQKGPWSNPPVSITGWSPTDTLERGLQEIAALEHDRYVETATCFVTAATCPDGDYGPINFSEPEGIAPGAYEHALALFDARTGTREQLEDLLAAVSQALET